MAMSRPAVAAENARRIVGQMVAAADNLGCRDRVAFDVFIAREGRHAASLLSETSMDVIPEITRQAEIAEARGYEITFQVRMHLPAFLADADDLGPVIA